MLSELLSYRRLAMSDNHNKEPIPFDYPDVESIEDYDNQFGEENHELHEENLDDVRGKSELANDQKLRVKGQKAAIIFMSALAILLAAFMTYRIMSARNSVTQEKKVEPKSNFTKPEDRTFGQQFQDVTASAPASTPTATVVENEPLPNTHGVTGTYPSTTIEPPPSYSSSEVSRVSPPVESPPSPPVEAPQAPVEAPPAVTAPPPLSPEEERKIRIYQSGLSFPQGEAGAATSQNNKSGATKDPLVSALSPASLDGTSAVAMKNRDFMLTKGSIIDCALNTKFDSSVVGMVTCSVTRNVYGANGRVVLIDRGSKVTGEYKGGMQQGQNRVFILWNRIETPKGVVIDINSPAAGALGEAGADGRIDTKFMKRFGGGMLVSLVSDLGRAFSEAAAKKTIGGDVKLEDTANTAQQKASVELEKSINIPPSLIKHQGDRMSIFVARDVYFGDVYQLKRK